MEWMDGWFRAGPRCSATYGDKVAPEQGRLQAGLHRPIHVLTPEEDALCADGPVAAVHTIQRVEEVKRRRPTASSSFQIPQGSFVVFVMLALTLWIPVYDRLLVPLLRRITKREGGITLLQRIGIGMVLSVVTMLVAAAVERRRRRIGPGSPMMSCFWLVPQQVLAGLSEAFAAIGQTEFYYRQFPENMRSVAGALYFLGWALASYASGLMVTILHRTTGWLAQDLDEGRVDLFYLVTGAIAAVNLVYFMACARWYRFKKSDDDHTGSGAGDDGLDESPKKAANAAPV
ncbi:protein NRT1/ PTR FAMILY 2.11-like [Lolium rigidum]|uniref:protein NRT1/ PTR FAMILY 2.11-like n=1 Tax=Lolium rigidum TaxID=89674 RepID=UPI001F5CAEE3|nr:protein NRT1/ PTR FAMILY 2.11-like [Lolium rigidum]